MSTVTSTPYYLFTREQLLGALEAHVAGLSAEAASIRRSLILEFLDGQAANAYGLVVTPAAIDVRENSV